LYHVERGKQNEQIHRIEPIKVKVEIEGKSMSMELDTGASVSIIYESQYIKHFSFKERENDGLKLQYYTNEIVETLRFIRVNVSYNNNKFSGKWYIIRGNGPMLLGRE